MTTRRKTTRTMTTRPRVATTTRKNPTRIRTTTRSRKKTTTATRNPTTTAKSRTTTKTRKRTRTKRKRTKKRNRPPGRAGRGGEGDAGETQAALLQSVVGDGAGGACPSTHSPPGSGDADEAVRAGPRPGTVPQKIPRLRRVPVDRPRRRGGRRSVREGRGLPAQRPHRLRRRRAGHARRAAGRRHAHASHRVRNEAGL